MSLSVAPGVTILLAAVSPFLPAQSEAATKVDPEVASYAKRLQSYDPSVRRGVTQQAFRLIKRHPAAIYRATVRAGEVARDAAWGVQLLRLAGSLSGTMKNDWQTLAPELPAQRFAKSARDRARAVLLMHANRISPKLPPGILLAALEDPVAGYRYLALDSLRGAHADVRSIAIARLRNEPAKVVRSMLRILVTGMQQPTGAVLPFVEAELRSGPEWSSADVILARLGAPGEQLLAARLRKQVAAGGRVPALRALNQQAFQTGQSLPASCLDAALLALGSGRPKVRMAAIQAVATLPAPPQGRVLEALRKAVRRELEGAPAGRRGSLSPGLDQLQRVFARMGQRAAPLVPDILPHLEKLVPYDRFGHVRLALLAQWGASAEVLVPRVRALLQSKARIDSFQKEIRAAVRALGKAAEPLLPAVLELDKRSSLRCVLLAELGEQGAKLLFAAARDRSINAFEGVKVAATNYPELALGAKLPATYVDALLEGIARSERRPASALAQLIGFTSHSVRVRIAAAAAMVRFGKPGRAALAEVLRDHPTEAPKILEKALILGREGQTLIPEAIRVLRGMPENYARGSLIRTLGTLGVPGVHALEVLHGKSIDVGQGLGSALFSKDPKVRVAGARAVIGTQTCDETVSRGLRRLRESSSERDRYWGQQASASIYAKLPERERRFIKLGDLLAFGDASQRIAVLRAYRELDSEFETGFPAAVDCLLDPSANVRVVALQLLRLYGPKASRAAAAIETALTDGDEAVVAAARSAFTAVRRSKGR